MVDSQVWLPFSGTGDSMANLAIDSGFFLDESIYQIRIICSRSAVFDNYGKCVFPQ